MLQLILNLLKANCPLDKSMNSIIVESLMFCHLESNRDTEGDILLGDRGATSLGEEILQEAR